MEYNIAFKTSALKKFIVSDRDKKTKVGGVYAIPIVTNNNTLYYIGKTKRNLQTRIKEHKNSLTSIYGNTELKKKKMLLANKEAQPKWEEAKILATPHTEYMSDIYENIMIWKFGDKCINTKQSKEPETLWQPLMKRHSKN